MLTKHTAYSGSVRYGINYRGWSEPYTKVVQQPIYYCHKCKQYDYSPGHKCE